MPRSPIWRVIASWAVASVLVLHPTCGQAEAPIPPGGKVAESVIPNPKDSDGSFWSGLKLGITYDEFAKFLSQKALFNDLQLASEFGDVATYQLRRKDISFEGLKWQPEFQFKKFNSAYYLFGVSSHFDSLSEMQRFAQTVERKYGSTSTRNPLFVESPGFKWGYPSWTLGTGNDSTSIEFSPTYRISDMYGFVRFSRSDSYWNRRFGSPVQSNAALPHASGNSSSGGFFSPQPVPEIDYGPYMKDLDRRIKRHWFPPKGHKGKRVEVQFAIHRDGTVSSVVVSQQSGSISCDEAALTAIHNAAPFKELPVGAPATIPIQFKFDHNQ